MPAQKMWRLRLSKKNLRNNTMANGNSEIRNVLVRMNRIKGQMLRISNTDPRLKVKMYNSVRRLDNLRRDLRRLQNAAGI